MIIDAHTSVIPMDPDLISRYASRSRIAADPTECLPEATVRRMDRLDIDASIVWLLGKTTEQCRSYNNFIADVRDQHPDRFIPFATVAPHDLDSAVIELNRAASELDVRGLKIHPLAQEIPLNHPNVVALVQAAGELGLDVVVHVNVTRAKDVGSPVQHPLAEPMSTSPRSEMADSSGLIDLIRVFDSPCLQSAHMGGVHLEEVRQSQISFQTAGASSPVIDWAVQAVGPERVIFGSDFPFFTVESEISRVRAIGLDRDSEAAILGRNVERLFRRT
jgi:predicted TIM-barrel fold metal-dependent hydrolase